MTKPLGVDVAGYQSTTFSTSGLAYAFVKVTEGTTYLNPNAAGQVAHTRSAGLLPGLYHFQHTGSTQAQAEYFVKEAKAVGKLRAGDMLACDWETDPATKKHATSAEKDAFIKAVKKLCPDNRVGLYCNVNFWTAVDTSGYCGDFLWIADPNHPAGSPGVQHAWTFQQYAISGGMDRNVANFNSAAELIAWAKGDDDVALTAAQEAALALIPDAVKKLNSIYSDVMGIKSMNINPDGSPEGTHAIGFFEAKNRNDILAILKLLQDPSGYVAQLKAQLESLKITIGE